jgi:hypothetical protein
MRVLVVGLSLALSALVPTSLPSADSGASVQLSLDDQANKLWKDLHEGPAGQVSGLALTTNETQRFTASCAGLTAIYSYSAWR